jgi:hypothetical protein
VTKSNEERRVCLSDRKLERGELQPPTVQKQIYYRDTKIAGPCASVSQQGNVSFVYYRKLDGKPYRKTLGQFDPAHFRTDDARALAGALNAALARGENPFAPKRTVSLL